jgi:hypothetical protein
VLPTAGRPPARHWRPYGNNYPLPTDSEALDEPFAAFPSWFMHVTRDRCGQERTGSGPSSSWRRINGQAVA